MVTLQGCAEAMKGEGFDSCNQPCFANFFACGARRPAFTSRRPPDSGRPVECALHKGAGIRYWALEKGWISCVLGTLIRKKFACGARAAGFYKPPAAGKWQDPAPGWT